MAIVCFAWCLDKLVTNAHIYMDKFLNHKYPTGVEEQ